MMENEAYNQSQYSEMLRDCGYMELRLNTLRNCMSVRFLLRFVLLRENLCHQFFWSLSRSLSRIQSFLTTFLLCSIESIPLLNTSSASFLRNIFRRRQVSCREIKLNEFWEKSVCFHSTRRATGFSSKPPPSRSHSTRFLRTRDLPPNSGVLSRRTHTNWDTEKGRSSRSRVVLHGEKASFFISKWLRS